MVNTPAFSYPGSPAMHGKKFAPRQPHHPEATTYQNLHHRIQAQETLKLE